MYFTVPHVLFQLFLLHVLFYYFNLESELGLVQEGMWADLVLLDANPIENIANTKSINAVIKNGRYLDKKQLNTMLKRARNPEK